MKSLINIMFALPFFALGQNSLVANELEKHEITNVTKRIESHIKTALINDIKKEKSILDFDLNKSYHLSINSNNDNTLKFIDDQKPSKMRLKTFDIER